jgi:hypothetical protein
MIGTWGCCVKGCFLNKRMHKKLFVKKKERVDITAIEGNNLSLSEFELEYRNGLETKTNLL